MIDFEKYLDYLLQRDVTFVVNNKVYKKGKIILYTINDFHISFVMKINDVNKTFEMPVPFDISYDNENVLFDYTFNTLSRGNPELLYKLQSITREKKSKLCDKVLKVLVD